MGKILLMDVNPILGQNTNTTSLSFDSTTLMAQRMIFQTYGQVNIDNSTIITSGTICLYHMIHFEASLMRIWANNYVKNLS